MSRALFIRCFRKLLPAFACALPLCGCSSYRFIDLNTRLQKADLPNHFNREREDKRSFGVEIYARGKSGADYALPFEMKVDSLEQSAYDYPPPGTSVHTENFGGTRSLELSQLGLDLSFVGELSFLYYGLSGGVSLQDPGIHNYGALVGVSEAYGGFVPSLGFGLYRARQRRELDVWESVSSHSDLYGSWIRHTESGFSGYWDVSWKAGLLYKATRSLSPFIAFSGNRFSDDGPIFSMACGEISAGLVYSLSNGYRLEGTVSHTRLTAEGRTRGSFESGRLKLSREF